MIMFSKKVKKITSSMVLLGAVPMFAAKGQQELNNLKNFTQKIPGGNSKNFYINPFYAFMLTVCLLGLGAFLYKRLGGATGKEINSLKSQKVVDNLKSLEQEESKVDANDASKNLSAKKPLKAIDLTPEKKTVEDTANSQEQLLVIKEENIGNSEKNSPESNGLKGKVPENKIVLSEDARNKIKDIEKENLEIVNKCNYLNRVKSFLEYTKGSTSIFVYNRPEPTKNYEKEAGLLREIFARACFFGIKVKHSEINSKITELNLELSAKKEEIQKKLGGPCLDDFYKNVMAKMKECGFEGCIGVLDLLEYLKKCTTAKIEGFGENEFVAFKEEVKKYYKYIKGNKKLENLKKNCGSKEEEKNKKMKEELHSTIDSIVKEWKEKGRNDEGEQLRYLKDVLKKKGVENDKFIDAILSGINTGKIKKFEGGDFSEIKEKANLLDVEKLREIDGLPKEIKSLKRKRTHTDEEIEQKLKEFFELKSEYLALVKKRSEELGVTYVKYVPEFLTLEDKASTEDVAESFETFRQKFKYGLDDFDTGYIADDKFWQAMDESIKGISKEIKKLTEQTNKNLEEIEKIKTSDASSMMDVVATN